MDEVGNSGASGTQQNLSRRYSEYGCHPHHCYYFCEVSANGTLVGSARRIVQVQGE